MLTPPIVDPCRHRGAYTFIKLTHDICKSADATELVHAHVVSGWMNGWVVVGVGGGSWWVCGRSVPLRKTFVPFSF